MVSMTTKINIEDEKIRIITMANYKKKNSMIKNLGFLKFNKYALAGCLKHMKNVYVNLYLGKFFDICTLKMLDISEICLKKFFR